MDSYISKQPRQYSEDPKPKISVIIPYYKQEAFIADTVQSVLRQSYPAVEIVLVDDGSPVPAADVLDKSLPIQLFRIPNGGAAAARNFGFHQSTGEYLIFLDSDDRLAPGAIEAHLSVFRENPEAGLVFGPARVIDQNNKELSPPHVCRPRRNYFLFLMEGNPVACPGAAMLRREAFVNAGLFDEVFYKRFPNAEDYHLYLRLARRYPIVRHRFCVADYRFHTNSKSQNKTRVLNATLGALDQLAEDPSLTARERGRLRRGRGKIINMFRPEQNLASKLKSFYFKLGALGDVPLNSYLRTDKAILTLPTSPTLKETSL